MKKIILATILLLTLPFATSENIVLTHIGFGNTPQEVIINIFNNQTTQLQNPSLYVDGKFYTNLEMLLPPKGSANYILYLEPGEHEIEIRYKNESSKITVNSFISPNLPEAQTKTRVNETTLKAAIVIIILLLVVLLYFLILRKPRLIK